MITNEKIITSSDDRGYVKPILKNRLVELDDGWFLDHWCSCGTSFGHRLHDKGISVTPGQDSKKGYADYDWANGNFLPALYYTNSTTHREMQFMNNDKKYKTNSLPADELWIEYLTPLIEIYNLSDLQQLVKIGKAEYFDMTFDSPTHKFAVNEPLREYAITPGNKPNPPYLIFGSAIIEFPSKQRDIFLNYSIPKLQEKYSDSELIFLPNARLSKGKLDTTRSGIYNFSYVAMKFLEYFKELCG
jgi:hypothetical protein